MAPGNPRAQRRRHNAGVGKLNMGSVRPDVWADMGRQGMREEQGTQHGGKGTRSDADDRERARAQASRRARSTCGRAPGGQSWPGASALSTVERAQGKDGRAREGQGWTCAAGRRRFGARGARSPRNACGKGGRAKDCHASAGRGRLGMHGAKAAEHMRGAGGVSSMGTGQLVGVECARRGWPSADSSRETTG